MSITVLGDAVIERNEIFGLTVYAEVPSGSPAHAASSKSGDTTRSAAATGVTLINLASADGEIKQGREFTVQNLTRYALKYDGPAGYGPRVGAVLNIGQKVSFTVPYPDGSKSDVSFKYMAVDSAEPTTYDVGLRIDQEKGDAFDVSPTGDRYVKTFYYIRWDTKPFDSSCTRSCGWSESTAVALWDSPATTVTVGDEDRRRQEYLLSLCDGNGASSCSFAINRDGNNQPIAGIPGWGLTHLAYRQPQNTTTSPSSSTFTVTDATTQGTSWSLSSSLKPKFAFLDKIVDATISGSYGGSNSSTHTFSQSTTLTVQPGETGYIFTTSPVLRYTGTWTVILGNPQNNEGTTYTLTDTYIDRLNTSTGAKFLLYTCKTGSDSCRTADSGKVPDDLPIDTTPLPDTTQGAGLETRNV